MAKSDKKTKSETDTETETKKDQPQKAVLRALQNTQLPNGDFVAEGQTVYVAPEYAEAVLAETNSPFERVE